ncbi:MAG: ExeM/NucH family extracellular endonuclease, partial [Pseudomonadota bacterium]
MATTLTAGDIAIISFYFDNPDEFSFVALVDIMAGTEIKFTDNGWLAANAFRGNEGTFTWTAPADISAGTVITPAVSSVAFSAGGDQILAYQGDDSSPTFIYALNSQDAGVWQADATSSSTSALPNGLVNGQTAVALFETDNAAYTGPRAGSKSALLAAISDKDNWTGSNARDDVSTNADGFSVFVASDLFISEYIEGSSNNKAIEIFNGTGGPIDLSAGGYTLERYNNGAIDATDTLNLTGTIADLDVFVIGNAAADQAIRDEADVEGTLTFFNGDDAIVLRKNGVIIDVIGQIGSDPGNFWPDSTQNKTLRRKSDITEGDSNGSDAFTTVPEWDTFDIDTFDGLGQHTFTPGPPAPSAPAVSIADVSIAEGLGPLSGGQATNDMVFTVTLSEAAGVPVTVDFATSTGPSDTATENADYGPESGTLQFSATETEKTITVQILTDDTPEPDETFTVTLSNPTGGLVIADGEATGTIENDDFPNVAIHAIQGDGETPNLLGDTVIITGVVVGDYDDNGELRGFFVQEEDADADADPLTSEGIFVFTAGNPSFAVSEGNLVSVTGEVAEFFDQTQLTNVSDVTIIDSAQGNLVTPTVIDLDASYLTTGSYEQYEGMLVEVGGTLVVSEYFQLNRFGQIILTEDERPYQFTQLNAPSVSGYAQFLTDLEASQIILDDTNNVGNNYTGPTDVLPYPEPGLSTTNFFRGGDTIDGLTGVLSWNFAGSGSDNAWRLRPVESETYEFDEANPRPATPEDTGGNLTVASFNVLNYFTTLDNGSNTTSNGSGPRGANTTAELERQTDKIVAALAEIDADIVGLVELENSATDAAIAALVTALNDEVGAGTYNFIPTGEVGTDAIAVGIIYKPGSVTPNGDEAVLDTDDFVDPLDTGSPRNRPAVAQTFTDDASGEDITVVVNHFKSKNPTGGTGDDADHGDGAAGFNATRTAASVELDRWLDTNPTGVDTDKLLILGDLNAYAEEDPITTLEAEGYTDLAQFFVGEGVYSYLFDSQIGTLDYILGSAGLTEFATGATVWNTNADEIPVFDYNDDILDPGEEFFEEEPGGATLFAPDAFRSSDHDAVIASFAIPAEVLVTTLDDTIADDGETSLREAFNLVNANNGTTTVLEFADDLGGDTLTLESLLPTVTKDVVIDGDIDGDGVADITIDGDDQFGIFIFQSDATVNGLVIQNGLGAVPGNGLPTSGGITATGDKLTVTNSVFRENENPTGPGGAIRTFNADLTIEGSVFVDNTAFSAGAVSAANDNLNSGTVKIRDTTFIGNSAVNLGGAITTLRTDVDLFNVTLVDNSAGQPGSALVSSSGGVRGDVKVINSTVTQNGPSDGAPASSAIVIDDGSLTLGNSIVLGNAGGDIAMGFLAGTPMENAPNLLGAVTIGNDAPTTPEATFAEVFGAGATPGDNGGPVPTLALLEDPDNPALDAGDDDLAPDQDARGNGRVDLPNVANGGTSDLGAFELQNLVIPPENQPPTLSLDIVIDELPEDTDVSDRIKVADVVVTDP